MEETNENKKNIIYFNDNSNYISTNQQCTSNYSGRSCKWWKIIYRKGTTNADGIKAFGKDELKEISNTIYNVLLVVGIVIAVILGAIMGVKFIIEGAEGKAEVQKALVPYVIGCVVVFGAFAIWKIVVTILQNASL